MSTEFNIGDSVTCLYKSGKYIGEIIDVNKANTNFVVKILAVVKHPTQGDLHNPGSVNVPLFHERKALSFQEKTNVPKGYLKPFDGDIPAYTDSLKATLDMQKQELNAMGSEWAKKSLEMLRSLEKDYFK